ncbi:MAG: endopeptidase La [Coprococcus sp.]|nr:endopeptidase La [Coprococcus sp.]MBP3508073.1 endopeptidase La [Lachnospiraceae bacterium]
MEYIIWSMPMMVLRGITIMPGASTHLDVVNKDSCEAATAAMKNDGKIFLVTSKNISVDDKNPDLYNIGVTAKIKQFIKLPNKSLRILLETEKRGRLVSYCKEDGYFNGDIEIIEESNASNMSKQEHETYLRMVMEKLMQAFSNGLGTNKLIYKNLLTIKDLGVLTDGVADFIPIPFEKKQEILEAVDLKERVLKLLQLIEEELDIIAIRNDIKEKLQDCVNKHQKEYVLREQLKVIKKELGEDDIEESADELAERLNNSGAPKEVKEKLAKEINRYKAIPQMSAESGILLNYIETLLDYPWGKSSDENENLEKAIKILEKDHYKLSEVKERIIDYLAVHIMNKKGNMPIICLVGPPGTGKTSIAKSIASATNKEYIRMSLGGVRDEAEIRGHRKTYIGAMPGRIAQSIAKTKTDNPLILLDEVDKVSSDYKGDVSSALLEVLDGEQNNKFYDHYFEVPIDLSKVLFVATANDASLIPGPLLDRMEIIEISGYTEDEKYHIAKLYLVDKAREKNGLKKSSFKINSGAIRYIIRHYTREAGVRSLERTIDKLCRKACRMILTGETDSVKIDKKMVVELLGPEKYKDDSHDFSNKIGAVRGLAWTAVGGVTLDIEVNVMPGNGQLQLTGKMGDVMKESAIAGMSYIRALKESEELGEDFYEKHDIHIHIPEGAIPKDGPSAGITMATALYSAIFNKPVKGRLAMTGEITLRGNVLAIGGLKEKLLAAKSIGIKDVIIPESNVSNLEEVGEEVTEGMNIIPVSTMKQVLEHALA